MKKMKKFVAMAAAAAMAVTPMAAFAEERNPIAYALWHVPARIRLLHG